MDILFFRELQASAAEAWEEIREETEGCYASYYRRTSQRIIQRTLSRSCDISRPGNIFILNQIKSVTYITTEMYHFS